MGWFALAVLVLNFLGCGKGTEVDLGAVESPSNRTLVVTSDYSAVVMVVLPRGQGICTGTFISPTTIVTAAHCTQVNGTYTIAASFGTFHTSSRRNFGPGEAEDPEDLALLVLSAPVARAQLGQVIAIGSQLELAEKVRLVGFGCTDFELRRGAGVKRTGTNTVSQVGDYIELFSPKIADTSSAASKALIGSETQTGTCFGDSGGPLLQWRSGVWGVAAISHGGGKLRGGYVSAFVNLNRPANMEFLRAADAELDLGIFDACRTSPHPGFNCQVEFASVQIEKFIRFLGKWLKFW